MIENLTQISYKATEHVHNAIANLGRTEDIHLSPNGKLLAIASILNQHILILNIDLDCTDANININISDCFEVFSSFLAYPHGVFWVDDHTIAVANRSANVVFFKLPNEIPDTKQVFLKPTQILDINNQIQTPGSLFLESTRDGSLELLVCNNYAHNISRHRLEEGTLKVLSENILLKLGLSIPDGVAKSDDQQWIAISNHDGSCVFIYENTDVLNSSTVPDAILTGVSYPHGLRFSSDGHYLLLADAGQPFVYVYQRPCNRWFGLLSPILTLRTMDESTFKRGQDNPMEGGPKGLYIDRSNRFLIMTCREQPLAFFSIEQIFSLIKSNAKNFLSETPLDDYSESERQKLLRFINCLNISQGNLINALKHEINALERELLIYRKRFSSRVRAKLSLIKLRLSGLMKKLS